MTEEAGRPAAITAVGTRRLVHFETVFVSTVVYTAAATAQC